MNRPIKQTVVRLETILVVDDDPEWRDYLCRIVGQKYPVIVAHGGDEALRIAAHTDTKVIILDIMMAGGKDGFTTFCALRKSPETRAIPVIMLSEVNRATGLEFSSEAMREYLGDAPFAFMEKPVSPDVLMKKIEMAVGCGCSQQQSAVIPVSDYHYRRNQHQRFCEMSSGR